MSARSPKDPPESLKRTTRSVWRLTVRLTGVMPIVWRTILVRPETKLLMLHRYLQAAMGWRDCHLFAFTIDGKEYGIPRREWQPDMKVYDARRYTVARLFPTIPARCMYLYDFGDEWDHVVEIEGVQEAEFRRQYPICIAGAEPCPTEDCGGPSGYKDLRTILTDPAHPRYAECTSWAEAQHYPTPFRSETATWAMRDVQRGDL
jgi:pRiA4b ORF-3-like protein